MESHKRLFIGFPIEIDASLETAIKRTKINAQQKEMEVHWVPRANFHVTLVFLGNTSTARIPEIERILTNAAKDHPPFATTLKGLGAFPDNRHMRVIWVGLRLSRNLSTLQNYLRENLITAGFELESRDYLPHLTLGRLRKSRTGTDLLSPYVRTTFGKQNVASMILYESVLHGPSPIYVKLNKFELSGVSTEDPLR